jgi:hypothetical protein
MNSKKYICKYCLENFDTNDSLKNHSKTSKMCSKYKDILFTCKKCNFSTVGIKNIEQHMISNNCKIIKEKIDFEIISDDENEINLKKTFENEMLEKMNLALKLLKNLNNNYRDNNDIQYKQNIENIIPNITLKNNNLNNILPYKNIEDTENKSFPSNKSSPYKTKKCAYKKLKDCLEIKKEIILEDKKINIEVVKEQIKQKNLENEKMIEECNDIFQSCFENLKTAKRCKNHLDILRKTRNKLINCMNNKNYCKLLNLHINILQNIFKDKEYNDKKTIDNISKCLNSIDTRYLYYHDYTNIKLEIEDIQKLEESLKNFNENIDTYTIFDSYSFFEKFNNYGLAIFNIKKLIEIFINNKYEIYNVIYVPLKKSTETDPYSFYILEDIKSNKRYWKMDCRLEELTNNFTNIIINYLTNFFKKLYHDLFNDNIYRKDYKSYNSIITHYECEQLLKNIYMISNQKKFSLLFRNIIKENCTYYPSEIDRFNIYIDDLVQKKRFTEDKGSIDSVIFIKNLFDDISHEDAVDLYREIKNNTPF